MNKYKEEPRYEDDPFEDEEQPRKAKAKKLFGNTEIQKLALAATGRSELGFRDNEQWKKFQELETPALGMKDEARVWKAWMLHRIDQTKHFNVKAINISMDKLIHNIGLVDKYSDWALDNRVKVLKEKSAEEVSESLEDIQAKMLSKLEK